MQDNQVVVESAYIKGRYFIHTVSFAACRESFRGEYASRSDFLRLFKRGITEVVLLLVDKTFRVAGVF